MNTYIIAQCNMMKSSFEIFLMGLEASAKKDDGSIDREEQRFIDAMKKEVDHFTKVIDKHLA